MLTRINHVSLFVHNIDEALSFYSKHFGFIAKDDVTFDGSRWATMHLPQQPDLEVALMLAQTPEMKVLVGKQGGGAPIWAVDADDCHKTYEELKAHGVTILETPTQQPWGIQMLCQDLYGNILCIVEQLKNIK